MQKNKMIVLMIVGLAIVIFGALFVMNNKTTETPKAKTSQADEFLIKPHSPIKGDQNAAVTIVEFLDPECEACRAMHPIVKRLLQEYEGKVRLVIRYMPLHGNSKYAASALEEARDQGKFDVALDTLFANQPEWGDHHSPRPKLIEKYLREVGVTGTLDQTSVLAKHGAKIEIDRADGVKLGVQLTPTFFVNGVQLPDIGYAPIKQAIDIALENKQ